MRRCSLLAAGGAAILLLLLRPGNGTAFYSVQKDDHRIGLRGSLNAGAGYVEYPADNFIYDDSTEILWNGDLRLLGEADVGENFRAEANFLQNIRSTPVVFLPGSQAAQQDVERSSLLYLQEHDTEDSQASLVADSLSIALGGSDAELIIGRQPINLSVTFYFTPNDFFAPFAPQHFYREYKAGVDAVRYEQRVADLTQVTLLGVLGYDPDPDSDSGWSRAPDWQRASVLGRITHIAGDYELGLLGGVLSDQPVLGFSLQGDMFQWLGIRAEGHYGHTWKENLPSGLQLSIGLEHRFTGKLIARVEQLYNGTGYDSIGEANQALAAGTLGSRFLGRDYTALDVNYEITPLLSGELLYLRNWTDSSGSLSFYGLYSLSDESEVALTMGFPFGDKPDLQFINSEFGITPVAITLEYRLYF